jgi:hypothetical protein
MVYVVDGYAKVVTIVGNKQKGRDMRKANPFDAVDFIYKQSKEYAQAKAHRVYMEEYRKSLKAILMKRSLESTVNAQEREAYSHAEYVQHLKAIQDAIENEEELRWQMVAKQAEIEVWRSQEASNRLLDKTTF